MKYFVPILALLFIFTSPIRGETNLKDDPALEPGQMILESLLERTIPLRFPEGYVSCHWVKAAAEKEKYFYDRYTSLIKKISNTLQELESNPQNAELTKQYEEYIDELEVIFSLVTKTDLIQLRQYDRLTTYFFVKKKYRPLSTFPNHMPIDEYYKRDWKIIKIQFGDNPWIPVKDPIFGQYQFTSELRPLLYGDLVNLYKSPEDPSNVGGPGDNYYLTLERKLDPFQACLYPQDIRLLITPR